MEKTLDLQVVTPERAVLTEQIEAIVIPAPEGYLGILPNHAPIITGLEPGMVKYHKAGKKCYMFIGGGFMEVSHNKITILADVAEKPEEIDKARAQSAKERAEKRIKTKTPGIDEVRAELALKKALARLRVANLDNKQ